MLERIVWTAQALSEAIGVKLPENFKAGKVEFNSADIEPGDIFIALPGEKRDGHEFVENALSKGAAAAICSKAINSDKVIHVDNSFEALIKLAKYKRKTSGARYIGVTGSVGKTSTKEAIGSILSNFGTTFVNKGNFNNHIGVPLTLASIPLNTKFSVNEMGMNHAGEIRELTKLVKPDIAVITNIAEAHLEFLGSLENICKAKCEIFEGLTLAGTAIVNLNSPYYQLQRDILKQLKIENLFTFGESSEGDCYITDYQKDGNGNIVTYNILGQNYKTRNQLIGKHQAVNIGAALLVAHSLGLDLKQACDNVENISAYYGRGIFNKFLINDFTLNIIDDAYNANPTSVKAALRNLAEIEGKKIAILADMRELGPKEIEFHKSLADSLLNAGISKFFAIGTLMKHLYDEVKDKIEAYYYEKADEKTFADIYSKIIGADSSILLKGSNSTRVREFLNYIKASQKN